MLNLYAKLTIITYVKTLYITNFQHTLTHYFLRVPTIVYGERKFLSFGVFNKDMSVRQSTRCCGK